MWRNTPEARQARSLAVHKSVLLLWMIELGLFPFIAAAELGFSMPFSSNYLLRFSYIALFGLAVFYHLVSFRKPYIPLLSVAFGLVLLLGGAKGLLERNFSQIFLSHGFYVTMPVVMLSYGYFLFSDYRDNPELRRLLRTVMYVSLASGFLAMSLFVYAHKSGYASYNAIGLWNGFFSGPFLINLPHGAPFLFIAIITVTLSAKRGILAGFAVNIAIGIIMRDRRWLWIAMIPLIYLLVEQARVLHWLSQFYVGTPQLVDSITITPTDRLESTVEDVVSGNINAASSGRVEEALSAIRYLTSRFDHLIVGAGFGAQFVPWAASPNYLSHYTHISPLSYIWLGGIPLTLAVYLSLGLVALGLLIDVLRRELDDSYRFLVYWMWSILVLSMFGAVLMNNAWLWLIFGLGFAARARPSIITKNILR